MQHSTWKSRPFSMLAATVLAVAASMVIAEPAHAVTICEQYGTTTIQNGRYVIQNNRWGASTAQCINTTSTGFSITTANHNNATNGAPASYPSVYLGCHYGNCTSGSNLPIQVSQISTATSSINYQYVSGATYNAAYDIWLDPTPRTTGQNGTEIMIWFNRQGSVQPIGSPVGNTTIGGRTWQVWQGNIGWNVISYLAPSAISSWNFDVLAFINDVRSRGAITNSWYLTSIQAGFEPWIGGAGLAVTSFSAAVNGGGGGGDTQAPTTPGQPTAGTVTSSSVALSWSASSDNVGVTGYDVLRNGTQVASVGGTSYTDTGLSASTAYSYTVRARDAAGNVSALSPARSVTTQSGGGGGSGCRIRYTPNVWNTGFTADVTITNSGSSTINGWTLTYSLPSGQTITNSWNVNLTQSGSAITARDVGYNGTIAPSASTSFGYQANYSGSYSSPGSFSLNGSACTTG